MAVDRPKDEMVERLLSALRAKIMAKAHVIHESNGDIRIRVARKGDGFQIDLSVSV
jgi:hypothetical protein